MTLNNKNIDLSTKVTRTGHNSITIQVTGLPAGVTQSLPLNKTIDTPSEISIRLISNTKKIPYIKITLPEL